MMNKFASYILRKMVPNFLIGFILVIIGFSESFAAIDKENPKMQTLKIARLEEGECRSGAELGGQIDGQTCCGNSVCEYNEDYVNCPSDCSYCGDGACTDIESPSSCSIDCGTCGNHVCDTTESALICPLDCALPTRVRLDKVRRCTKRGLLCMGKNTYPEYHIWESEGVSKKHQRKTYISKASEPAKNRVRHLIFISAGQQGEVGRDRIDNDSSSKLTGQHTTYKNHFGRRDSSQWVNINRGLAHKVLNKMGWGVDKTFVGLAFDSRFNFQYSSNEKWDIEEAYYKWLKGKFDPSKIESIYLAGHSRGGCLVARLGAKFANEFPNVPVIIHSFDGVCVNDGNNIAAREFGVTSTLYHNPIGDSNDWSYAVDLASRFLNRDNVAFFNQISGDRFLGVAGARSFTDVHGWTEYYLSSGSRPWLEQRWWNHSHEGMDKRDVQDSALEHIKRHCSSLDC